MSPRADRKTEASRYPLRFGIATLLLISGTLVLVLVVLPQRYVLSSGFRESGMTFPAPTTPFLPVAGVPIPARPLPAPPAEIPPGPAELLWAEVTPLLRTGQFGAAVPVFQRYLAEHPADGSVRRELAITLLAAGRPAEAVPVLASLSQAQADPELGLLLARTLRDLGRTAEASSEYARLSRAHPGDLALTLEWAQAHAWAREYERAAEILGAALSQHRRSVPLRVELARVYYSMGSLHSAEALLDGLGYAELAAADALGLRDDVRAALFVPPEVAADSPPPTPLERAARARADGDFELARTVLDEALAVSPDDAELWQARADLLEYELVDLDGARSALLEVERLGAADPDLQLRLAQLEIWTGRNAEATSRLERLLASLESGDAERAEVSTADVLALLGDLRRWEGDRIRAARSYRRALAEDPGNPRARDGLTALDAEVARQLVQVEAPRVGGSAYSLGDTDDYARADVGAQWTEVRGLSVWSGSAGNRWLGGFDLEGLEQTRQGVFAELEVARWWRLGTIRTGVSAGVERVRAAWDARVGLSLGHRGGGGQITDLRYDHAPAYPITNTLQSVLAAVVQDRLSLSHARALDDRWSLSTVIEVARLRTTSDGLAEGPASTGRIQLAASAGRAMTPSLTLGVATRALTFTRSAPPGGDAASGNVRPLFWDPEAAVSAGPYVQLGRDLSTRWRLSGRINPGLALIDERRSQVSGYDFVPHVSAEAGVRREGARFSTALDVFYYQGQFDGYRTYGARLSVSARDLSTLRGAR